MKALLKSLLIVSFFSFNINAQVTKITAKNGTTHYLSTAIDYPISGIYLFEGLAEPIVELNSNGTGIYQLHELPKHNIIWGLECNEYGKINFVKGFNSAVYNLWYKKSSSDELFTDNSNTDDISSEDWTKVQFSIHFNKKKMYIQGERVKSYGDELNK